MKMTLKCMVFAAIAQAAFAPWGRAEEAGVLGSASASFRMWTAQPGAMREISVGDVSAIPPIAADGEEVSATSPKGETHVLATDTNDTTAAVWSPAPDRNGEWTLAKNGETAMFFVTGLPETLAVTAGIGGVVVVEAGGVGPATVGPGVATNLVVAYGSSVTATAEPAAGFAVVGSNAVSIASFLDSTNLVFSFVPTPDAALRWKFSSAVGRYFAQVAVEAHAGYDEALEELAYIFADRANGDGEIYAQLWNAAARAPEGVLVTDRDVEYRGVTLGSAAFAGQAEGERTIWGVADASFAETRNIVPAGERQIGLYVRKRVNPVSGNETVAEVENFLGYLTWTTQGTRWFLPVVEGGAAASPSQGTPSPRPNASFSVSYRPYAPATLNAALALGLGAEAVADNPPKARIAEFGVGADGSVSGRVEAVAGGEASSRFGAATVRILSTERLGGVWAEESSAEVDPATGEFALPAGAVNGRFFKASIETREVLE